MTTNARTETLEQIADRVAPNGNRAAQMKAAKAKAKQAVASRTYQQEREMRESARARYTTSRAPFQPNEVDEEPPFSEQREADEPTQAQQDALSAYIAAREERDGLRDDLAWGGTVEQQEAFARLSNANAQLGEAIKEATRLGVIEQGRRMFR